MAVYSLTGTAAPKAGETTQRADATAKCDAYHFQYSAVGLEGRKSRVFRVWIEGSKSTVEKMKFVGWVEGETS
jgi:hypothetical protein